MKTPRVYFYCCDEATNLQDDIIQLAEGLDELGIPFFSSANYWLKSPKSEDYLFRATPNVSPEECDVVVLPTTWSSWVRLYQPTVRRPLPRGLFYKRRKYLTVFMDTSDSYRSVAFEPEFRQFDVVFRAKFNKRSFQPSNFKPWNHGMSFRIIRATENPLPFSNRRHSIVFNFGASHPCEHPLRKAAKAIFRPKIREVLEIDDTLDDLRKAPPPTPYDRLMWEQTNCRHSISYYERLKNSQAVACFCGQLVPCFPADPRWYTYDGPKARVFNPINRLISGLIGKPDRSLQWDSWRFWESLAAGCATFHIDLEKFGVALPVMPRNWEHYIGIDLNDVKPVIERLRDDPGILAKIANKGHEWVMNNYAPKPTALRFLRELGLEASPTA